MKKNLLLIGGLLSLSAMQVNAQELQTGDNPYVQFPSSSDLYSYVKAWNNKTNNRQITVNGKVWEDEEFFVSRVKPRTRVTQTTTNIYDFGDFAGRRSLWWVPIGLPGTQALPNGRFDSEVFTMWSYLDHYGEWTAPFGWSVGAMSDIAHKNGVSVSGVASTPNSALSAEWKSCFDNLSSDYGNATTNNGFGDFLLYHGCDGFGYNSEWTSNSPNMTKLIKLHDTMYSYMIAKNPIYESIWYDGVNDSGGLAFDSALSGKTGLYKSMSMFSNYNWTGRLSTGQSNAESVNNPSGSKRGPWWQYAGMNQQGGEPKSGDNYNNVMNYKWSLGWWGAHSSNMFWEGRNGGGSGEENMLKYYMNLTESFFGNGPRNPAIKKQVKTVRNHRPTPNFHGVSALINERSAMNHKITTEPFYTFFNLGNGKFFNWKGERVSDNQWYSIGIQDYMPTWRFWFAPQWMQKNVTEGTTKLDASFTWEDAYFGGSCLKIEGSTSQEYLHLFKTAFTIGAGQVITVRYKLLEGEADIRLVLTSVNEPQNEKALLKNMVLCTVDESEDIQDESFMEGADGWVTKTFTVAATWPSETNLPGKMVGCVGLEFKNAKNMKLLLGEFSILPAKNTATPAAPKIKSSKILANVYTGVDGKIFWTMDNDIAKNAGTPKYNSDVNTSMFKVYAQEEGGPETFVGATTSWAAVVFRAPNTGDQKKIRFGVSAVSMDTRSESAISWGDYLTKTAYTPSDAVDITKGTIKPGEGFEVYYVDPRHSSSTWAIKDTDGRTVKSGTGTKISVPEGITTQGGYDVVIDAGTAKERILGYFVQITDDAVGALPEIYSLAVNGQDVKSLKVLNVKLGEAVNMSYTGRSANGSASRAIALNSRYIGTRSTEVGLSSGKNSFSIAGWFYFKEIPSQEWNFMNCSDKTAKWPQNTWGWAWNHGHPDGTISCVFRGDQSDDVAPGELHYDFGNTVLRAGAWTHIAWICEYNPSKTAFRNQLYVNGVLQTPTKVFQYKSTRGGAQDNYSGTDFVERAGAVSVSASDYFYFGGAAHQGQAIDGVVDDFQIWNKAMTAAEVKQSMKGLDRKNLPSGVAAFWDFEEDANDNDEFIGYGSSTGTKKAFSYEIEYQENNPEKPGTYGYKTPAYASGCPFLAGTAYPIITSAEWKDLSDRRTVFTKLDGRAAGEDEGVGGSVSAMFVNARDHNIQLTLSNSYGTAVTGGEDEITFPVITVPDVAAIDGVGQDMADVVTSVEGRVIYFAFQGEGAYALEAYNTAGMLVANEAVNAVSGSVAEVTVGATGIYLVKVVKDGKVLRTIKVAVK